MTTKRTPFIVTKKRCEICKGTGLERKKKQDILISTGVIGLKTRQTKF